MTMKTCLDCSKRVTCKKPCDWLESQLRGVEQKKEHITFSELGLIDSTLTKQE